MSSNKHYYKVIPSLVETHLTFSTSVCKVAIFEFTYEIKSAFKTLHCSAKSLLRKFDHPFSKEAITRPNQVSATFAETWVYWNQTCQWHVCHREGMGCACLVMRYTETRCPILRIYYTAVVRIKLKSTKHT